MREKSPIAYDDKNNIWGVFRYNDVRSILANDSNFSNFSFETKFINPSRIGCILRMITSAFTQAIVTLKPRIEEIGHCLINQSIEKGNMDLINDLAHPLSVAVICELLGIPAEDYAKFQSWANKLIASNVGDKDPDNNHHSKKNFTQIQKEMYDYFNVILDKRIRKPKQDLITSLIKAKSDGGSFIKRRITCVFPIVPIGGTCTNC
jgi:cytochrome P450 family 109